VKHLRNPELPGEWVVLRELDFGELAGLAVELDARGGMAPVLGWAMLAAAAVSQAQAAEVSAAQVPPFLARTPVRLLRAVGFSEYLVDTLALLGLDTLQRCRDLTRRQLEARFGPEGKRLFHFLHPVGAELIPVYRPTSLTAAEAWDEPAREPAPLLPYLSRALDRLLAELGHRGCESISLELTGRGGRAPSRTALLKAPTRDRGLLLRRFEELLLAMLGGGLEVGQLRMTLRGITAPAIRQQDFFKRHLDLGRLRQTERRFPGKLLRVRPAAAPSLFPEENAHYEPLFTQG
jgi:nucleotidyltransferase/DNA polymerase involved in DNA repair